MGARMKSDLRRVTETWEVLGKEDPLWAVFTHPDKRGGGWDLREFMETGEQAVARYHELITKHVQTSGKFSHVLDFGCGVGRLTFAWANRAKRVTGVDISAPMLQIANSNLAGRDHINFILNQSADLRAFKEGEFDLVFSFVCLQHMPWPLAAGYIAEFSRICQHGGVVAFQLPSRKLQADWIAGFRKSLVESLPFGIDRLYRRWRRGSSVAFEMHFTPSAVVEAAASAAGLKLIHREPDASAGMTTEGFFYVFGKS
jgi:ubiquinone/menaquinone biosynthesis C-methylase UbiE